MQLAVGVMEHLVERHVENPGDLKGHLQRGRVAALLDRDDRLPGYPDLLSKLRLGHLAMCEPQYAYRVGDLGRLAHDGWRPRRYATTLIAEPATAHNTNPRYSTLAIQK